MATQKNNSLSAKDQISRKRDLQNKLSDLKEKAKQLEREPRESDQTVEVVDSSNVV